MNDADTFLNEVNEPLKDKDPAAFEDSEARSTMDTMLLSTADTRNHTSYQPPVLPDTVEEDADEKTSIVF